MSDLLIFNDFNNKNRTDLFAQALYFVMNLFLSVFSSDTHTCDSTFKEPSRVAAPGPT